MISFIPLQKKDHPKGSCFILDTPIRTNDYVWCDNYEWLIGSTIRVDGLLYKIKTLKKRKPGDKTIEVICDRDKVTPNTK